MAEQPDNPMARRIFPAAAPPDVRVCGGLGPYENTVSCLAGLDLSPGRGMKVLLKPTAGRIAIEVHAKILD